MRNDVTVKVLDYGENESPEADRRPLVVKSHLHGDRVVLKIRQAEVVVIAKDLIAAVESATSQ